MDTSNLNKKDESIINSVEPYLEEGEEIESFIEVTHFNAPHLLVLTGKKVFLAQHVPNRRAKKKYKPIFFSRYFVKEISFKQRSPRLCLDFSEDELSFKASDRRSKKAAKEFVENIPLKKFEKPSAEIMLADLETLEKNFNILLSAEQEIKQVRGEHAKKTAFEEYIKGRKTANLVVGGMLAVYLIFSFVLDLLYGLDITYLLESLVYYVVFGGIIYNLLRFRPNARTWAIIVVILPLVFSIIGQFSQPDLISFLLGLTFTGSLLLILVGKPKRIKVVLGSLLFLLGGIGPMFLSLVFFFLPAN
jgi:hypothetical protein